MRSFSRIKNEVGTVAEIDAGFTHDDERLSRRWKRRRIAYRNCNKAPKEKIKKGNQENDTDMEIVTIDSDYEDFLNDMKQLAVADDEDSLDDNVKCDGPVGPLTLVQSCDGDILDPQYMMFLDNLKEDGNSYVLTLPFGYNTPLVIKYEEESDNDLRKKNMEAQNKLRNVPMIDRKVPVVEDNVEMEPDNVFHCTTNDCHSDLVDESYQVFLNSLEGVGQDFVYAPEGGEKVVYEKDESSDSDSEVFILDDNPFTDGDHDPFVSSKSYFLCIDVDGEGSTGGLAGIKEAQFRKKLMEILQKPYDNEELKDLMREASRQRPIERIRVLRGTEITYTLTTLGKSYLEEYRDLARKIHEVNDDRRVLNVLRGFFYWLQNLSFEGGAFKPWLDAACSEVLPTV